MAHPKVAKACNPVPSRGFPLTKPRILLTSGHLHKKIRNASAFSGLVELGGEATGRYLLYGLWTEI